MNVPRYKETKYERDAKDNALDYPILRTVKMAEDQIWRTVKMAEDPYLMALYLQAQAILTTPVCLDPAFKEYRWQFDYLK